MRRTSRTRRSSVDRTNRRALVAIGVAVVFIAFAVTAALVWQARPVSSAARERANGVAQESDATTASDEATSLVEIPDLVGVELSQAQLVLETGGFRVVLDYQGVAPTPTVLAQDPAPGTVAQPGSPITLTVPRAAASQKAASSSAGFVVCIDPGHQSRSDSRPEPVGPGSKDVKPRVTGGATGAVTRIPECEIALQIAMNLQARLEAQGVKVVMTRTTNDVTLSNAERAEIANKAGADVFVRIHGDGSPDAAVSGVSTLYPAKSSWTAKTSGPSKSAASLVQAAVVRATGAVDRGVVARGDIAGFNYATMPSLLVECGFLSNAVEDRLLSSPHYQDKVAGGIAEGVMRFLEDQ